LILAEASEVTTLGQVLAEQAVSVLVAPALPRAVGIAEVDGHTGVHGEGNVLSSAISGPWSQVRERRSCVGRVTHRPARTEVSRQFAAERAVRLHEQAEVGGFMGHSHLWVVGMRLT
jgi:hypothetical protein